MKQITDINVTLSGIFQEARPKAVISLKRPVKMRFDEDNKPVRVNQSKMSFSIEESQRESPATFLNARFHSGLSQ